MRLAIPGSADTLLFEWNLSSPEIYRTSSTKFRPRKARQESGSTDFRISWASDKFRGIIWVYRLLLQRHLPLHAALTGQPAEGFNVPDAMCRSLPWPWLLFLKPSTGRQNVFSAYEEPKPFSRSSERLDKEFLASRRSPLRTNDEQPCVRIPIRVNARGVPWHSILGWTLTFPNGEYRHQVHFGPTKNRNPIKGTANSWNHSSPQLGWTT